MTDRHLFAGAGAVESGNGRREFGALRRRSARLALSTVAANVAAEVAGCGADLVSQETLRTQPRAGDRSRIRA